MRIGRRARLRFEAVVAGILGLVALMTMAPQEVLAEDRWVVGVKTGATLGFIGLELEREWAGRSVLLNAGGGIDRPVSALLIGRQYLTPNPISRPFFDVRLGTLGTGTVSEGRLSSFVGAGLGFEWRPIWVWRINLEVGIGVFDVDPSFTRIVHMGVFFGLSIGSYF